MDRLQPKEFGLPILTEGGNLTFGAFCDTDKVYSILSSGIRPRRGKPERSSYYPNVVSLTALDPGGYAMTVGIKLGWIPIRENAERFNKINSLMAAYFSFAHDPVWIESNTENLIGVGGVF